MHLSYSCSRGSCDNGEEAEEEEVNTKGGDCDYVRGLC